MHLVTGRQHRHHRSPVYRHTHLADRRQQADFGRIEHAAARQHQLATRDILPDCMNAVAGLDRLPDHQHAVALVGLLDHDYCIGTLWHGRAGHDSRRCAGRQYHLAAAAGDQLTQHAPLGHTITGAQGVAIHRCLGHIRLRCAGKHILGQHAPIGDIDAKLATADVDLLCPKWRDLRGDQALGLVDRHHGIGRLAAHWLHQAPRSTIVHECYCTPIHRRMIWNHQGATIFRRATDHRFQCVSIIAIVAAP
jgi:hypothetical protein